MSTNDLAALIASILSAPNVNKGPLLERVIWILLSLSIIVVALRMIAKLQRTSRLYADDILMLVAIVFGIAHAVIIQISIGAGFGHHIVYLTLPQISTTMKFGALSLLFGFMSPMFGRLSFCWTLLYLTRTDSRMKTWPILVCMILQVLINVTGVVVFYAQCGSNLDIFWNIEKQLEYSKYCWNAEIQTDYQYFMGSFNTLTDVFLAVLPAVLIEHTSLSRKSKLGVAGLLCLSVFAMVASIIKTYEAQILSEVTDYTYVLYLYVIWMSVELNVVMITASIPLLRPLFMQKRGNTYEVETPRLRSHAQLDSLVSLNLKKLSLSKNTSSVKLHTPQQASLSSLGSTMLPGSPGITVTREVEITYQSQDAPEVHAALVGLIQGEIFNPRLARR